MTTGAVTLAQSIVTLCLNNARLSLNLCSCYQPPKDGPDPLHELIAVLPESCYSIRTAAMGLSDLTSMV